MQSRKGEDSHMMQNDALDISVLMFPRTRKPYNIVDTARGDFISNMIILPDEDKKIANVKIIILN